MSYLPEGTATERMTVSVRGRAKHALDWLCARDECTKSKAIERALLLAHYVLADLDEGNELAVVTPTGEVQRIRLIT